MRKFIFLLLLGFSFNSLADYQTSFRNAKSKAEKEVYFDHNTTFYCQCDFVFDDTSDADDDDNIKETFVMREKCG
ncbi:MAG: deoxyribonuclease-1 [Psychroserpens sp.]|jgi:deoxyribonuclease-1